MLPTSNTVDQWPPKSLDPILPAMDRWGAWWSNSLDRLQAAYGGGTINGDRTGFFESQTGGPKVHSIGPIRWFVGEPSTGAQRNTKLPVPIAAEICQASADLLFSDPVTITVTRPEQTVKKGEKGEKPKAPEKSEADKRLEVLLDEQFHTTIAEAAESAAALGGVYLRATWDDVAFPEGPFTTVKDADTAIPEFKFGRLIAVTFWSVIARDGKHVYRHLERHELNSNGVGIIRHGLYDGEEDTLGTRIGLTSRTETAPLAAHEDVDGEGTIDTKSPGLAVEYVPNQTPNRMWRKDPIGRNLGRSDLDGIEHLLDQLAETMSDWMRARRAARARVMHAKELVKSTGPGKAAVVDLDQETYVETAMSKGGGATAPGLKDLVQVLQPTFNPEQYKITAEALIEQILQMAGYSMQTFGVQPDDGGDQTATEIEAKERRSLMTRARKVRAWTPALRKHVTKLLAIDRDFFGHSGIATPSLEVEFSDGVQESQVKLGEFVRSLFQSESASREERVRILHPDWDETQIGDEVALLAEEFDADPLIDPIMSPFNDGAEDPADK